jgi:hypothetical protein
MNVSFLLKSKSVRSAKYLGEREGNLAKKRGDERKKCDSPCHVSLCGRGNELRALSIVAGYLATALFYLTNDTLLCSCFSAKAWV